MRAVSWDELPLMLTIPEAGTKVFGVAKPTAYELFRKPEYQDLVLQLTENRKVIPRDRLRKRLEGQMKEVC